MKWLFGGGISQVGSTAEQVAGVFRPNAENGAIRGHSYDSATLSQYAAEFHRRRNRTWIDSLADGLNRLVRPFITLAVFGVLPAVSIWPEHMAVVFVTWALLPTAYWGCFATILAFYFGGRMQIKSQDFERSVAEAAARAPDVIKNIQRLRDHLTPNVAIDDTPEIALEIAGGLAATGNTAVADWIASK